MALYKEKERTKSGKIKRKRESRKGLCMNTGRTHFKKGIVPWNKGRKGMPLTEKQVAANTARRGKPAPKPEGFGQRMREINKPAGLKYKSGLLNKKEKVWRQDYVFIYKPEHPTSRKRSPDFGYVLEHRYVMELHLGRDLLPTESIHHLDGDKSNNRIENLVVCQSSKEHNQIHTEMEMFVEKLIRENRVKYDRDQREFVFI